MISAIILAAGESRRMGQPKMLLPWGNASVLGHVLSTFQKAGVDDVIVVTGGAHEQVQEIVKQNGGRSIFNREFENGEMLSSVQCGLQVLSEEGAGASAALIGLGDQPQVQMETVVLICETFRAGRSRIIVPSFQMRRGHPWLLEKSLWDELLQLRPPQSPRDFLDKHADEIIYVEVNTPSILADLDTPDDYQSSRPKP
ncbi:MAG: nucleotidyltransferase family protein [Chloroflexota bacterium]